MPPPFTQDNPQASPLTGLPEQLLTWGKTLGFAEIGISYADTSQAAPRLKAWLAESCHGDMQFMAQHAHLRVHPAELVPGTLSVISATLPYWPSPAETTNAQQVLETPSLAYVSRYALGRDYHKVFRQKLQKLADQMQASVGPFGYRVFSDSAPVLEVEFAAQAKLGWRGKHSLLLNRTGSWFFLGEIYTNLPLPPSATPPEQHCGSCTRCIDQCPTQAIVAPYRVDARRCISYLTIEHAGPIPIEFRAPMGNRIYGCDDCQLACPWNRFGTPGDPSFLPRHGLDAAQIHDLLNWEKEAFDDRLAGSPIRRIGHQRWQRNLCIAAGNALRHTHNPALTATLLTLSKNGSHLVQEHAQWALAQMDIRSDPSGKNNKNT